MCNLYLNTTAQEALRQIFRFKPEHDLLGNAAPQSAIFADAEVPIFRVEMNSDRALRYARLGWSKAEFGYVTNACNLTGYPWKFMIERPEQRYLVPASAFSEYHPKETMPGASRKPIKAASWFRVVGERERPPFVFAWFCRRWSWEKYGLRKKADAELAEADTPALAITFPTTDSNSVVAPIYPKAMPVVLRTEVEFETWLHGDVETALAPQKPLPDDALELDFTGEKSDRV